MIKLIRKILAHRLGVPFQVEVWYNYRAMLPKNELEGKTFVECFDEDGKYIYRFNKLMKCNISVAFLFQPCWLQSCSE